MNNIFTVETYKIRKAEESEKAKKFEDERRKRRYDFDGKSYSRFTGSKKRYKKEDSGDFTQYKGIGIRSDYMCFDDDDYERAKRTRYMYHKELTRRERAADMAYGNLMYGPNFVPSKFGNRKKELRRAYINTITNHNNLMKYAPEARDAINRHIRRHPKQYN